MAVVRGLTTNDAGKARPADLGTGTPDGTKVLAGDGTWVAKGLAKPANPSAPAVPVIAADGTVTTTLLSSLGGAAQLNKRGNYTTAQAADPHFAVADAFEWQGVNYAVTAPFTGDATPDLSKTLELGVSAATALQAIVEETQVSFPYEKAGVAGFSVVQATWVAADDDDGGGDGSDWQTYATYRWLRAGLPATGTNVNGLHWTGATGNPDLVGDTGSTGGSGSVVTTYHGAKYIESANALLAATLPTTFTSSPGEAPAAVLMRFARVGPVDPTNALTSFLLKVGGVHLALQYQDARPTGQKLVWAVFLPDNVFVFPVTSGIDQSGMRDGASLPHLLVDVLIRLELDGVSSKLYCNGALQGTFDATATPTTAFSADNIDFGDPTFRGMWALSDIIVMSANATPARIAAAAATIPAGA